MGRAKRIVCFDLRLTNMTDCAIFNHEVGI